MTILLLFYKMKAPFIFLKLKNIEKCNEKNFFKF